MSTPKPHRHRSPRTGGLPGGGDWECTRRAAGGALRPHMCRPQPSPGDPGWARWAGSCSAIGLPTVGAHRCPSGLAGLFTNNGVQALQRPLVASEARGRESTPGCPSSPDAREGGPGGGGTEGRPHPGRAPAGGGDRGRLAGRGVCGSCGRGLRPSNSRLLAPRSLGGRGGRTWRRR